MKRFLHRNARVGDKILILKHNFSNCKGIREVIEIEENTVFFNVEAPTDFDESGYTTVKCGTPLDRFERYEGEPAYVVLNKTYIEYQKVESPN